MELTKRLDEAAAVLRAFIGEDTPWCAVVLGSGLNIYADQLQDARILAYQDVPHMPHSTVSFHPGRFVLGKVPGTEKTILTMQGRVHAYEGYTSDQVAFPVRLMAHVGVDTLLLTNAVGAINPSYRVGDFCLMVDQINFTGRNPLIGQEPLVLGDRFLPMFNAFDPHLRQILIAAAEREGVTLHEGVFIGVLGPSFETPAEIRAFGVLGADTVAMSAVEEVIAARHAGMRVAGLSFVSNMACGVEGSDPCADDVNAMDFLHDGWLHALISGFVSAL